MINIYLARFRYNEVLSFVLVAVGVTADDDGLGPAGHEPRDALTQDGLAEHRAAENVTDGSIGA